jgi:hypothetical protein
VAKIPLRFIPIGELFGDFEGGESIALPQVLSSNGSKNFWIDKYARATSIDGYARKNSSAVTSDTGAAAMRLRALYHYVGSDGVRREIGIFDQGAAGTHYEWRVSTDGGATWTFVEDFGSAYIGKIPSFAQLGNQLIAVFGVDPPKTYDGTTLADAVHTQIGAPTITSSKESRRYEESRLAVVAANVVGQSQRRRDMDC